MARRLLPLGLALASIASASAAALPELLNRPSEPGRVQVATPVFSARRAPSLTTRIVADAHLRADLGAVLADPALAQTRICLSVVDPDGHRVLDHDGTAGLIPASTIKLVTTATALARMGPEATFATDVVAGGPVGPDGGVSDLWLVGGGDPLLATADFAEVAGWLDGPRIFTSMEQLADRVVEAGVRRVGRVLGDESRYDTQRYLPTWKPEYATNPEVGPQSALVVNQGFTQWRPRAIATDRPATHAAGVLARLLVDRGVAVGGVGEARAPGGAVKLAGSVSPPLTEVIRVILQDSDNLGAELLVKEMGARFGDGGTTAAGLAVVASELNTLVGADGGFTVADGSGLDRGNRMSCELIEAVLATSGPTDTLGAMLARSGSSGTLVRRFAGTVAADRVQAKTGSLSGVVGLAGWTFGGDGRPLRFALIANELPRDSVGFALQESVSVALARYPAGPAPAEVSPIPAVHPPE